MPPYPDQSVVLYSTTFDDAYYAGQTNSTILIPGIGTLDQSWSGYALQRMGDVIPFIVPAVDSTGNTNVSCDTCGAFRFWLNPYWTSASVTNGNTPGTTVTVLELDAVNGTQSAVAWSLQISVDGNTMSLFAQTGAGLQEVLQAPISWQAGTSHNVVLDFGSQTALFLDGAPAAQGSALPSIPPSVGQLVIGSTLAGGDSAGADFDEFYSFNRPLTSSAVGQYWTMTSAQAALGPISDAEQTQRVRSPRRLNSPMDLTPVYDPDQDSGCVTGGPPYLTNFFATATNGTTTVQFSIRGGTNGVFYDVYYLTNIRAFFNESQWTWACDGLTCNTYTITNQPADYAFYFIIPPVQLSVIAWGDNSFGQCNVPLGLTNADAVAGGGFFSLALQNGTVIAWGDNTYGQTNIPAGITNAASIAAGQYHALALLSNGCVQSWGSYCDGSNFYFVTNYSGLSGPPTSNVMAIAAGIGHDLALMSNGTVVAWGLTNLYATSTDALAFQSNLTGVKAIACGWNHNVALLSNGVVQAWGLNVRHQGWDLTNVPVDLTNVEAIAAGALHSVAFSADGSVKTWGSSDNQETNVLSELADVVAISAGSDQSLALEANGTFIAWGISNFPAAAVPTNLFGVKAFACGFAHNLAIASSTLPPLRTEPPAGFAPYGQSFTFSVVGVYSANVQYQWQFNGTNLTGQTTATLTLNSINASDNGNYQVVISNANGTATSLAATFALALPPQINSTTPHAPITNWMSYAPTLSVDATAIGQSDYPLSYQWQLNGTNIAAATNSSYMISGLLPIYEGGPYTPTNDGKYTVVISNALGSTNATWTELLALPGMVEAWGDDTYGECDRPATLTNALAIAAGDYHSVAVTDSNTVTQWGDYSDGTNFFAVGSPPSYATNLVAVAASIGHDIALGADGSVIVWGLTNDPAVINSVPTNVTNAKAVAAGWFHNVALLTNGTVVAWGGTNFGQTDVPGDLTNVTAIAAGEFHSLALRADASVEAWGCNTNGQTNVPMGLSNVVAIAAGGQYSLALKSDGTVVSWGTNNFGPTNFAATLSNVMAIAAGSTHSVALKNDGTLVVWGENSNGQTNIPAEQPTTVITLTTIMTTNGPMPSYQTNTYPSIVFKLIAAGGNHTMAAIWSPLVQYPVDVSKDLLLIYNTSSPGNGSSNVCAYYLANRPMVANCTNVLAITCTTNEIIDGSDYATYFSRANSKLACHESNEATSLRHSFSRHPLSPWHYLSHPKCAV